MCAVDYMMEAGHVLLCRQRYEVEIVLLGSIVLRSRENEGKNPADCSRVLTDRCGELMLNKVKYVDNTFGDGCHVQETAFSQVLSAS